MRCFNCHREKFETKTVELITQVGPHRVVDHSVRRPVCVKCGEFTVPAETLTTVELRAAIVALHEAPAMTGSMLRFARKALDLTQAQLAGAIGTTAESVSRWEREERPMEQWVRLAVLGLVHEQLMPPLSGVEFQRAG
jgi:DNA-binding transcriptional regulator YiaG